MRRAIESNYLIAPSIFYTADYLIYLLYQIRKVSQAGSDCLMTMEGANLRYFYYFAYIIYIILGKFYIHYILFY